MVVSAIMTGVVPFAQFKGVDHPVSLVLQMSRQNWVAGIIDIGAVLGMTTVMLVMLYGQTRVMFAMSRDGLVPGSLSKVHQSIKHLMWRLGFSAYCLLCSARWFR